MLRVKESQRTTLSKPIGKLYEGKGPDLIKGINEIRNAKIFVAIGDLVSLYSFQAGFEPDVVIIDFKTERSELNGKEKKLLEKFIEKYNIIEVKNPQGHITEELVEALFKAIKVGKTCIIVDGEEDMSALPLALILPENSLILFGIPKKGILAYTVTDKDKILISRIIEEMEETEGDKVKNMLIGGDVSGNTYRKAEG